MTWDDLIEQQVKRYCQMRGIMIVRGKVSKQYKDELKSIVIALRKKLKSEYRIKKTEIKKVQSGDFTKILNGGSHAKSR